MLLGGGDVSFADVEASIAAGRPVLVVSGSGGTANAIAAAVAGADGNTRASAIAASGLVTVVPMGDVPAIGRTLGRLLGGPRAQRAAAAEPEPAAPTGDYRAWLRNDYGSLIDQLDLPAFQRHVLRSRWLDQLLWAERAAGRAQWKHYALRLMAIIGGVLIPALVAVSVTGTVGDAARVAAWVVGVLVAISVGVDALRFFRRWRHYRRVAEALKAEGLAVLRAGRAVCPLRQPRRRRAALRSEGRGAARRGRRRLPDHGHARGPGPAGRGPERRARQAGLRMVGATA